MPGRQNRDPPCTVAHGGVIAIDGPCPAIEVPSDGIYFWARSSHPIHLTHTSSLASVTKHHNGSGRTPPKMPKVHLLDYVAGNVRSLVNAIEKVGYEVEWIRSPEDVKNAEVRTNS